MRPRDGQYRWLLHKAKLLSDRICVHPTLEGTVQGINACFCAGLNVSVRRVGAGFADGAIDIMVEGSILPSLLHQDPRYFYQGTGTNKSRALHVFSDPFICRGRQQTAAAELLHDRWGSGLGGPRECLLSQVESWRGAVLGEFLYRHWPARARLCGTGVHPAQAHAQSQESKLKLRPIER